MESDGHGKGLPEFIRAYCRHVVVGWIGSEPGRTGTALAKKIGVSKGHISTIRGHDEGAGYRTAKGLADVLGISWDEFETRAKAWWEDRLKQRPPLRAVTDEIVRMNADMPGWAEAEKRARARTPLANWTFLIARRRTGLIPKDGVTPEYVTAEALLAFQYASPEEKLREENEELDQKIHRMRSKHTKRKSKRQADHKNGE
jgi:transcriptional regulator with XRE-family HTH domain